MAKKQASRKTTVWARKGPPNILEASPAPEPELRSFHGKKILGWSGEVRLDKVQGWVENRRVELFVKEFKQRFAKEPTPDQIYEHMVGDERDFRIKELAKNISANGLRMPIYVTSSGTLLDGNRRYAACRFATENQLPNADELATIKTWALAEASEENERLVLVESNFLGSFKLDWKPYVKAHVMWEDRDNGLKFKEIAERYGMEPSRVRAMIMAMDLINEFVLFCSAGDDPDDEEDTFDAELAEQAEQIAYRNFVQFEEAHNKLRGLLDSDETFREHFFKWMLEDRFATITQIRKLGEVRNDQEAWAKLQEPTKDAVRDAIAIAAYNKVPGSAGGEKKLRTVLKTLRGLREEEIAEVSKEMLAELSNLLTDVYAMAKAASGRERRNSPR